MTGAKPIALAAGALAAWLILRFVWPIRRNALLPGQQAALWLTLALAMAAMLWGALPAHAAPKPVCRSVTGIFGEVVSPLATIRKELKKRCRKVYEERWWSLSNAKVDIDIGHSKGADAILRTGSKRKVTLDPTFLNAGCPKGARCTNFHNPMNAFPLVVCCGGYPVRGANNIVAPYPHTAMPERIAKRAIKEAFR